MKSASFSDEFVAWTEIEMKGVGQNQIYGCFGAGIFGIFEHIQNQSFDGRLGSDRHKDWGCEFDAIEGNLSNSCISLLFEYFELELIHQEMIYTKIFYPTRPPLRGEAINEVSLGGRFRG